MVLYIVFCIRHPSMLFLKWGAKEMLWTKPTPAWA
jgi:hypothetical protein